MVPDRGIPKRRPASTVAVASKPARYAARAARSAASAPCARRMPKSTSRRPPAASTQRAALLATRMGSCSRLISRLSTSCASAMGAVTRRTGSSAKNGVPSGSACDVAREAPAGQPLQEGRVEASTGGEPLDLRSGESRLLEEVERLLEASGDQEAPLVRQAPHEELEDRLPGEAARVVGGEHRQLVVVGE
jgi:hypothetical protein